MPSLDKEELFKLYASGLSMMDISKIHKVSVNKVVYWMEKHGIRRRSSSEATYVQKNPKGDPFKIIPINTLEKTELLSLAIGLFLGEGNKRDQFHTRFTNSDSKIIKVFLSFIRKICCVKEQKIQAFINIFDDRAYKKCLNYWIKITGIPAIRFYKPTVRLRKIGTYKNKSKYGTITIVISNTKLLNQIKLWCNTYVSKYAEVAQW